MPVCIAKTQYSFSTDPSLRGAPEGHVIPVREVRLNAGAGFVVAICGQIMTMPGLPRHPAAETIMLDRDGQVEGAADAEDEELPGDVLPYSCHTRTSSGRRRIGAEKLIKEASTKVHHAHGPQNGQQQKLI